MNYFDLGPSTGEEAEEKFEDKPEEIDGREVNGQWVPNQAPPAEITVVKAAKPIPKAATQEEIEAEEEELEKDEVEEEDDSEILIDARLRLEMGKLYEMIMKHDLFAGVDADPKAVKVVQKEFRAYAQERMEIMLGMRQEKQETNSFPMDLFPFNSLEVDILKAIAATATKGESRDAEPLDLNSQRPTGRTTLNPIGGSRPAPARPAPVAPRSPAKKLTPKAPAPIARSSAKTNAKIQAILEEEGLTMDEINEVFDPNREQLDRKKLAKMTEEEIIARNKQVSLRNKRAENPEKKPMPTPEQLEQMYMQRSSQSADAQKPGWRQLIDMVKVMPPTIANNDQNNE